MNELRDEYDTNTTEGAIGGGTIGGWIAQALRVRPALLQYPTGLIWTVSRLRPIKD